jgi:hypothetical protein
MTATRHGLAPRQDAARRLVGVIVVNVRVAKTEPRERYAAPATLSLRCRDSLCGRGEAGLERGAGIDAHDGAVARAKQKPRVYQRAEQLRAHRKIYPPEPGRLRLSQSQSGHLEEFASNPSKQSVVRVIR